MMVDAAQVNYWAVLAATIATMMIGFLWYSPVLFGSAWIKQVGLKKEDMSGGGALTYILTALTALIGAYILALLATMGGETTVASGLTVCLLIGIAISAKIGMNYLFENRSFKLYLITAGYHLAAYLVSGLLIGFMQA
jgi:hypothetical protein